MKLTHVRMEWTDTGAIVLATIPVPCPRCRKWIEPNVEHRCGDQVKPVSSGKARAKKAGVR